MGYPDRASTLGLVHSRVAWAATNSHKRWDALMGTNDKISNKIDDVAGKAKEGMGKATGDQSTENEGKVDQAKSSLKDAGEKVKDAFKK